ncbi:glycosyltransferase family 4 protein [Merismopedia glauca]|uniref:Glycosyl transferase family 1 n=1 Tax=Merismopedia glauca CCAP 1448/3 TaxID=1296344 RepID=A0A2T1C793_9CYAN|nr:glycosyltransferase family 4 protein [Merismopedia glauca]PSB04104.1 glycosyl transferase family 1 [Merismopedia glauca CCAP 1448/3]
MRSPVAYISFDVVPAPKGAAIHIMAFSEYLAAAFGEINLVTLSPDPELISDLEITPRIVQTTLPNQGENLIERVLHFRRLLHSWYQQRNFQVIHFRSIYEGLPLALNKQKICEKLVFEVNGLPSIELKYRYPKVAEDRELLHKLTSQEQICLEAADLIVTPSQVTAEYLQNRGAIASKIKVIPNGVDLDIFKFSNPFLKTYISQDRDFQLLYFGTLSSWQGVNLAIEALELVCRDLPAKLTIIGAAGSDRSFPRIVQLASKLGVAERLNLIPPLPQLELVNYIHQADAAIAPLTPNDRNLVQGCCPLKVLESMAAGTPVISSDLPVVRELGINGKHFLLVKPGSAKSIKDAVLHLAANPELGIDLALASRSQIELHYTWERAGEALIGAYEELGMRRLRTASR